MSSRAPLTPEPVVLDEAWPVRPAIGGVPIVPTTVAQASVVLAGAALDIHRRGDRGVHVHLASAQTIALADRSAELDRVVNGDGWVLPDGKPLSWVSWLRRDRPRLHQTRGHEVFLGVVEAGLGLGLRHFLLGSTPRVLSDMQANLEKRFPGVQIVGVESPPFRQITAGEFDERDAQIRASGAHIVWVGLGTPKQDFEVARLAGSVPALAVAVGAVFDFTAGRLTVAPRWMSAVGLEWLFRLFSEPQRLWRRYTVDSSKFVAAVLRYGRRRRRRLTR